MLKLHSFMRNLTLFIILCQNTEGRYPILSDPENVFPGSGLERTVHYHILAIGPRTKTVSPNPSLPPEFTSLLVTKLS